MKYRYPRNERERRFLVSRPSDRLNGRVLYWTTLHLLQLRWKFSGLCWPWMHWSSWLLTNCGRGWRPRFPANRVRYSHSNEAGETQSAQVHPMLRMTATIYLALAVLLQCLCRRLVNDPANARAISIRGVALLAPARFHLIGRIVRGCCRSHSCTKAMVVRDSCS